jgi:hypothetical protein
MPVEKFFNQDELQQLITNNAVGEFKKRNAALIIGASYWGLTRLELCDIPLKCLMTKSGKWLDKWTLPAELSFNGQERTLYTADKIKPVLDAYLEWLIEKEVALTNQNIYRGYDGENEFFVNDNLQPFKKTERKQRLKGGKVSYQPRSLDDKLISFIERTNIQGATPTTYRDSWVRMMFINGCKTRDLLAVSGYKNQASIADKIAREELQLEQVFNTVYSRIKV